MKLLWIVLFSTPLLAAPNPSPFKRLDPHGSPHTQLKNPALFQKKECKSCHLFQNQKLTLKKTTTSLCRACHNRKPHSGLTEHLGKDLSLLPHAKQHNLTGKIDCLSCHRPHRAWINQTTPRLPDRKKSPSFLYQKSSFKLPKGLVEKRNNTPMLYRKCTFCHKWDDLP